MEMLKHLHSRHSRIRLARIPLHTKAPKEISIHLIQKNIYFSSKYTAFSTYITTTVVLGPIEDTFIGSWRQEENESVFREALEFKASAIHTQLLKLSPESLSNAHSQAPGSQDERQPLEWEAVLRHPLRVSAQGWSRESKYLLGAGDPFFLVPARIKRLPPC